MSIESFYRQSFIPQTWTASATFPFDETWTDGSAFKGALDTISSAERWADAQVVALSSHWIATKANVSLTKNNRIKFGTRIFEVVGPPDPCLLKPGHHAEIYVRETFNV
jgi:head-tail adaptor